jgi:predicted ATPase
MIERHPVRTVHHELQIHGRCCEIALDSLTVADVEDYLALRFGEASLAQALAGEVFRRTAGHPLFVVALVDHFVALEVILKVDGHWSLAARRGIVCPRDGQRRGGGIFRGAYCRRA